MTQKDRGKRGTKQREDKMREGGKTQSAFDRGCLDSKTGRHRRRCVRKRKEPVTRGMAEGRNDPYKSARASKAVAGPGGAHVKRGGANKAGLVK